MKLVMEYKFHTQTTWPALFQAPVYYKDGFIYYPYGMRPVLFCRKIAVDGTARDFSFAVPKEKTAANPVSWKLFEYKGHVLLSCGNQKPPTRAFPNQSVCRIFLDLDDEMNEVTLPAETAKRFLCPPPVDETADVLLSDCVMKYKNSRSYQCFGLGGKLLWTEKHKACRYTDFEEKDGCIIFGTAGHGGGLYCYRKSDGKCLCAVDTKGTTTYIWIGRRVVSRGRDGELLFINPFKGEIEDSLNLEGRFSDNSSFYADDKYFCAVSFEKKTNSPCISLFELRDGDSSFTAR